MASFSLSIQCQPVGSTITYLTVGSSICLKLLRHTAAGILHFQGLAQDLSSVTLSLSPEETEKGQEETAAC